MIYIKLKKIWLKDVWKLILEISYFHKIILRE